MTNVKAVWLVSVLLYLVSSPVLGTIVFVDGRTHNIDYEINDDVQVDVKGSEMQTTINLLPGGVITGRLLASGHSRINISGGRIGENLRASNNSNVTFSVGMIDGSLLAYYSSNVTISGGSIRQNLFASDSSQVTMTGGSIGYEIVAGIASQPGFGEYFDQSAITFEGSDFAINGKNVHYGHYSVWDYPGGAILTGTLAEGGDLNNPFFIRNGSTIILIPEPATVLLLGLGSLTLLRKRRALQIMREYNREGL